MTRKNSILLLSSLVISFVIGISVWAGVKINNRYEMYVSAIRNLEVFKIGQGRITAEPSLRHQLRAQKLNFLLPESSQSFRVDGNWSQIGGIGSGGWKQSEHIKTKAIETFGEYLCSGLLGDKPGGGDVWCLNNGKWLQIGGDGIKGSWKNGTYVTFLFSHDNKLYAAVDSEIWAFSEESWRRIGVVGSSDEKCIAYSAAALQDVVYFGVMGCGLRVFQYDTSGFLRTNIDLDQETLAQYNGVYELHNWDNSLVIGATAVYGTAGLFKFRG